MTKRRTITITEARALAERWEAQYQEHTRTVAIASRFKDAAPDEVIEMSETNRNERGQKLSQFEFTSLVERWLELFGAYPPIEDGDAPDKKRQPGNHSARAGTPRRYDAESTRCCQARGHIDTHDRPYGAPWHVPQAHAPINASDRLAGT
jgi:hypothetical protein